MRRNVTCLLTLLSLCPPLLATEDLATFGEVVDVHVINLEVVVTNRQGERVPGLPAEAFTLLVDDKPVTIQYFSEPCPTPPSKSCSANPRSPASAE